MTPFLAVGPEDLGDPLRGTIVCPRCGSEHVLQLAERIAADGSRSPGDLAWYRCGESAYIAGIGGRRIEFGGAE